MLLFTDSALPYALILVLFASLLIFTKTSFIGIIVNCGGWLGFLFLFWGNELPNSVYRMAEMEASRFASIHLPLLKGYKGSLHLILGKIKQPPLLEPCLHGTLLALVYPSLLFSV